MPLSLVQQCTARLTLHGAPSSEDATSASQPLEVKDVVQLMTLAGQANC